MKVMKLINELNQMGRNVCLQVTEGGYHSLAIKNPEFYFHSFDVKEVIKVLETEVKNTPKNKPEIEDESDEEFDL